YAAGSRFLTSHGAVTDMCVLGEPTEQKIVLGHYGSLWMRISTSGPFIHTAFSEGKRDQTSIVAMRDVLDAVLEFAPQWEERTSYAGKRGIVNIGAINGGFAWRVSRTPHRTDLFADFRVPPSMRMAEARAELAEFVLGLRKRFPDHGSESEVYVTAPGSEIAEDHPLVSAIDEAHTNVFGAKAVRKKLRWTTIRPAKASCSPSRGSSGACAGGVRSLLRRRSSTFVPGRGGSPPRRACMSRIPSPAASSFATGAWSARSAG